MGLPGCKVLPRNIPHVSEIFLTSDLSPFGSTLGDSAVSMRATVALEDDLIRKAQEYSGVTERTALLREALKALIHLAASRRLAAVGGTEQGLEDIKRLRVD